MKTTVFIATSVDGYIARENGDIDWLSVADSPDSNEDYGYQEFIETVDTIVMGRHTFEQVVAFGKWYYGDMPVIVLSSRKLKIPERIPKTVEVISATPQEVILRLEQRGYKHLYIDGGITIQRFLHAELINQLIITRIPILLGAGIPLFGPLAKDIKLRHLETRQFENGLVQSRYEVG